LIEPKRPDPFDFSDGGGTPIPFHNQFPAFDQVPGGVKASVKIRMTGHTATDFERGNQAFAEELRASPALRQQFNISETKAKEMFHADGTVINSKFQDWISDDLNMVWHHHPDLKTMQLVPTPIHGHIGRTLPHQGGAAYSRGVLNKAKELGILKTNQEIEDGLSDALIAQMKARNVIPSGWPF